MKIKVLVPSRRNPLESRSLIIAEDMVQPAGFNISEKCYPGLWVHTSIPYVKEDLINVSHPFLVLTDNKVV